MGSGQGDPRHVPAEHGDAAVVVGLGDGVEDDADDQAFDLVEEVDGAGQLAGLTGRCPGDDEGGVGPDAST